MTNRLGVRRAQRVLLGPAIRGATLALAGAALAACGGGGMTPADGGPPPPDAAETRDGGMPPADAGPRPDAATADAAVGDAGPAPVVISEREMAVIRTLSPLPALPPDPTNAFADDPAAAALGQALFFDPRYSGPLVTASDLGEVDQTGRVACASCHSSPVMSDDRSSPGHISIGAGFHSRNAPAIVNSAFYRWTNWGGRFSAQWELPPVVAEAGVIMNSSRLAIAHHIFDHYRTEYEDVFGAMEPAIGTDLTRFPATGRPNAMTPGPWESMSAADQAIVNRIWINYGKAIQAYQRRLISRDTPFDAFVAGDSTALSQSAQRGLLLFIGEARCISCHSGPNFSDDGFHNLGVPQVGDRVPPNDDGRFRDIPGLLGSPFNSAGTYSDDAAAGAARLAGLTIPPPEAVRGAFRTPTLRGVSFSAPYMHSGQMATLEDVIDFYDEGGGEPVAGTRDALMLPLGLTEAESADLVAFLESLSGDPIDPALRSAP